MRIQIYCTVETWRVASPRKTKPYNPMSDEKFQNKYCIKSARATWHDYSGAAYFITVCTKNREHSFGEIVETGHAPSQSHDIVTPHDIGIRHDIETGHAPSLQMTEIGLFLYDNLQNVNEHYPYAEIPLFVAMPNHWHAIVFIDNDKTPYIRGNNVETGHAPSLQNFRNLFPIFS